MQTTCSSFKSLEMLLIVWGIPCYQKDKSPKQNKNSRVSHDQRFQVNIKAYRTGLLKP